MTETERLKAEVLRLRDGLVQARLAVRAMTFVKFHTAKARLKMSDMAVAEIDAALFGDGQSPAPESLWTQPMSKGIHLPHTPAVPAPPEATGGQPVSTLSPAGPPAGIRFQRFVIGGQEIPPDEWPPSGSPLWRIKAEAE